MHNVCHNLHIIFHFKFNRSIYLYITVILNIYYKLYFFTEDKLYIVMDLIEGAPLAEHFTSLKEKDQKFSEERIWNIFIQVRFIVM